MNTKAETLCDALYMVVSGVPDRCDDHAFNITELALDLLHSVRKLRNPADEKVALHLRVGSQPLKQHALLSYISVKCSLAYIHTQEFTPGVLWPEWWATRRFSIASSETL